jgi:hypothetical protein
MEIHIHLACAYPHESWVEHIEWLEPAFNERLKIADGSMELPVRGLATMLEILSKKAPKPLKALDF